MVVANDNQITVIADKLFTSTTLQALILTTNKLSTLPSNIAECLNLRTLILSFNNIAVLPDNIARLRMLERIHLDNNKLKELPNGWLHLTKLLHMDISSNQLTKEVRSLNPKPATLNPNQTAAHGHQLQSADQGGAVPCFLLSPDCKMPQPLVRQTTRTFSPHKKRFVLIFPNKLENLDPLSTLHPARLIS